MCRSDDGFTLSEFMVASTVFLMTLLSLVACHLFGMRLFQSSQVRIGMQQEARIALLRLSEEIRSSRQLRIGNGNSIQFHAAPQGQPQIGNALQIYPSLDTNFFIRYFRDPTDQVMKRISTASTEVKGIAHSITNTFIFSAEDHSGTILTNNRNNRVIGMELQFHELQNSAVTLSPGGTFENYQWSTRMTRRTLE